jgi:hypothetical protein
MPYLLAVQLIHPGVQRRFRLKNGYFSLTNGSIVREWNTTNNTHYRKFIRNSGWYFVSEAAEPVKDEFLFWGEWEGFSYFKQLTNPVPLLPNGIHNPFHYRPASGQLNGHPLQNTDPYIFGDCFHYAVCKQRGQMRNLDTGSLILFGTSYTNHFALDTVFVVGDNTPARSFHISSSELSKTYIEETILQLPDEYRNPESKVRLYNSISWYQNKNIFSFVPVMLPDKGSLSGFERVRLPYGVLTNGIQLSNNKTGIKYLADNLHDINDLWEYVKKETVRQGFKLGIRFIEPSIPNQNDLNQIQVKYP